MQLHYIRPAAITGDYLIHFRFLLISEVAMQCLRWYWIFRFSGFGYFCDRFFGFQFELKIFRYSVLISTSVFGFSLFDIRFPVFINKRFYVFCLFACLDRLGLIALDHYGRQFFGFERFLFQFFGFDGYFGRFSNF